MGILKNRILWIVIATAVLAIVTFVFTQGAKDTADETADAKSAEEKKAASGMSGVAGTPAYQEALEKYADHRIQFDQNCQATPNNITYKDNTGIMLDNRSAQARTIKIGVAYTVKAWGFRVITLPDTYRESKTFLVDCDRSQNVATILVQE